MEWDELIMWMFVVFFDKLFFLFINILIVFFEVLFFVVVWLIEIFWEVEFSNSFFICGELFFEYSFLFSDLISFNIFLVVFMFVWGFFVIGFFGCLFFWCCKLILIFELVFLLR